MPVVEVGIVRVGVGQARMPVRMRVRFTAIPRGVVRMLVVRVMHMLVSVLQLLVHMCVLMMLRQVQPHA